MKKSTVLVLFILVTIFCQAQNITSKNSNDGSVEISDEVPAFVTFQDAEKLVEGILNVIGLKPMM